MKEQQISLGKTELQIPPLGLGTWQWGSRVMWGYGKEYAAEDAREAFAAALEAGVDFFDTAEVYGMGRAEELLGRFSDEFDARVTVATKFMPYPWRLRRPQLLNALRSSLERLGLEQVALYQIHQPVFIRSPETWAEALADAVEEELTRTVGVSNYNVEQMGKTYNVLATRGVPLASNQVEYSLLKREPERTGLLKTCRDLGVTLIAYSPLAQGILTGKYTPRKPPPGIRGRIYTSERLKEIMPLIELLREIGEQHDGKEPVHVALNWCICKGTVPIPGAKNAHHASSNAEALGWRLTDDEVAALDEASDRAQE
ncbi:MAG: aldo/keto reductase [Anaerolineales bacterium]